MRRAGLAGENERLKKGIYEEHKPTPQEAAKTAAGWCRSGSGNGTAISMKRHLGNGKRIGDLNQDD